MRSTQALMTRGGENSAFGRPGETSDGVQSICFGEKAAKMGGFEKPQVIRFSDFQSPSGPSSDHWSRPLPHLLRFALPPLDFPQKRNPVDPHRTKWTTTSAHSHPLLRLWFWTHETELNLAASRSLCIKTACFPHEQRDLASRLSHCGTRLW